MKSQRPKPLHRLCGKPMLAYVLESLETSSVDEVAIVVGHKADVVTKKIGEQPLRVPIHFAYQDVQRGTGDAAQIGLSGLPEEIDEDSDVIVLPGDAPLLRAETIRELIDQHRDNGVAATVLTAELDDPTGYGRVVRGRSGNVVGIVEQKDGSPEELAIREVNTSIYVFKRSLLTPALRRLTPDNAQGEYYLTDVVKVLAEAGHAVDSLVCSSPEEASGVNDRLQLAYAEREMRRRTNDSLMRSGVSMLDPDTTYVETTVRVGLDVTLFPGVILQGRTVIGDGSEIGQNTRLVDCTVGRDVEIEASVGREATIGDAAVVGPFASLARGTEVTAGAVTGPFYNSIDNQSLAHKL